MARDNASQMARDNTSQMARDNASQMANSNSLGIHKAPHDTRVVVAMSGGVDSSVVAAMLHEEGYQVIGLTMQLYDHGEALRKKGACCAGQDIYDARQVADTLGFPHYVLDYESQFRDDVIENFADSYVRGQTPIPCVRCNQTVKFRDMLAAAQKLEADILATGHYVQNKEGKLYRGVDPRKDQSYFLFATTPKQLEVLRFPLGGLYKETTRGKAEALGLDVADKPDSQDICFVPDGDYAALVARLRPEAYQSGDIEHVDGQILGKHEGIIGYTIGQRRGLGIGGTAEPLYVVDLDPVRNRVIVGPKERLAKSLVYLKEVNWLGSDIQPQAGGRYRVTAKLRSAAEPALAWLKFGDDEQGELLLEAAQYGIAPGQAAVFYDGARVLGGGWIISAEVLRA